MARTDYHGLSDGLTLRTVSEMSPPERGFDLQGSLTFYCSLRSLKSGL